MSNRTLSKGTLGLKFMNRVTPKPLISVEPTPPAAVAAPPPTTPVAAARPPPAKQSGATKVEKEVSMEGVEEGARAGPSNPAPPRTRQIIQEGSLLSFPLLSASASQRPFTSSSQSYSSMPMTASVISGRRSFGGANEEIERLNNPTLPPPPAPSTPSSSDPLQKKKRKKDEVPLNNVRHNPSASAKGSFQANSDEIKLGGGRGGPAGFSGRGDDKGEGRSPAPKKARVKTGPGGFAKPKGFDDVRRGGGAAGRGGKKGEVEPVWGKRGEERAWDVGKGSSEEEDEEEGEMDEDDDSDEDSDDVAELLVASAAKTKAGDRAQLEKEVEGLFAGSKGRARAKDAAVAKAEHGWDGGEEGSRGGSSQGKKNRRKQGGKP